MEDGSIVFAVDLDDEKAQKDLNKLTQKVDDARKKLEEKQGAKSAIEAELEQATKAANENAQAVKKLRAEYDALAEKQRDVAKSDTEGWFAGKYDDIPEEMARVAAKMDAAAAAQPALARASDSMAKKYSQIEDEVTKAEKKLKDAETAAGEAATRLKEAADQTKGWNGVTKELDKRFEKLGARIGKLAKRAFVFTVLYGAMREIKDYLWDTILVNEDASAALADLKGALLTLAQPIVEIVVPAFTALIKILTAIINRILQLVSLITGKSVSASAAAADALNKQTKALNSTGKAAKKASQQLASFDELNVMSSGDDSSGGSGVGSIAPDFGFMEGIDDTFQKIADWVLIIGTGLLTWKVLKALPWDKISSFFNGAKGFDLAKKFVGIAFVIAGLKGISDAIKDIEENGANLENVLKLIASIVVTGLGFSLLTGSVIPVVIAGIAAVVVAVLALTGNLEEFIHNLKENILGGLIDFLTVVFTDDWEKAWNGVKKIFVGILNSIVMIFGSVLNIVIKGINWLIAQLNKIHFNIPDWVPAIGGRSFGFNISPVSEVKLKRLEVPALAQGRVIPPNHEFLALLGDQKSGTNIETPLDTMVGAFRQALAQDGYGGNAGMLDVLMSLLTYVRSIADSSERTAQKDFTLGKPSSAAGRWVSQSMDAYSAVRG